MPWPALTPAQRELLLKLVDIDQELSLAKKDRTLIISQGGFGDTSGLVLAGHLNLPVDYADAVELRNRGFLTTIRLDIHDFAATVAPEGHAYASEARASGHDALANAVVTYISNELPDAFQSVSRLMDEAGTLLWTARTETDLTTIGHKVREAIQEFSDVLYRQYCPTSDETPIPRNQTWNKVKAFASSTQPALGDVDKALLKAVVAFWEAADQLAQKAEHGSLRYSSPLTLADVKRLVLLTLLTMQELCRFAKTSRA